MRTPFSPLQFILFIFVIGFLIAFIQIGLLTIAFDKLGLSQSSAYLLLFGSLFGSGINLPLFKMNAEHPTHNTLPPTFRSMLRLPPMPFTGKTIVAVNVGGCLIPLAFSLQLGKKGLLVPAGENMILLLKNINDHTKRKENTMPMGTIVQEKKLYV